MIWMLAEYVVEEDQREKVEELVAGFVSAVAANEPETLYDAWQEKDDPLSFVHLMRFADAEAEQRHRGAPYTEEFAAALYPRCRDEPTFRILRRVAGDE